MKTLELNLPTPVLLVCGLPKDARAFHVAGNKLFYLSDFMGLRDIRAFRNLPDGNWQLIGKLSELTDFNTRKAIKDKGYHIMNPYMMPNSRNYSAKQLENDNSDYWNKYNKWKEAQDKTLPDNTLIFKRV